MIFQNPQDSLIIKKFGSQKLEEKYLDRDRYSDKNEKFTDKYIDKLQDKTNDR